MSAWLREIGEWVFNAVPFRLGLIGWMISGTVYASQIEAQGIPETRGMDYLWPESEILHWYPSTLD